MFPQPVKEKKTKSTGPRTEAGKAKSSQNAIRHGLASGTLIMPGEDQADFDALLIGLLQEWAPATQTEQLHVENMAAHQWLVERARRLQSEALAPITDFSTLPPSFAVLLRYQTANERAFVRTQILLEKMQELRKTPDAPPPPQFVSQSPFTFRPFPPGDYEKHMEVLRELRASRESAPSTPPSSPQPGTGHCNT